MSGEEVDPEKFQQLCEDMTEVKGALLGNEEFRQKGALERIDENEQRSYRNKHRIDRIWFYAIGAGAVLYGVTQALQVLFT